MMKKLLSTVVAIVCLLCNTIPIQAQKQGASVTSTTDYSWTVYFDNHKLTGEQMYVYVWDANHTIGNGVLGAFPGAAMTLNNKGIWEHTFTTSYDLVSPMVLFSNGYDQQTQDYVFVNGKTYILEEIVSNGIYYAITSETDNTVEVTYRGNNAYEYANEYIGVITIPSTINHKGVDYTVTAIGRDAFMDCIGLTEVSLPETVTQIGSMAFWGCSGLKNFTIGKNISFIENNVFNLSGLTELHIEATTPPHINEYTLYGLNSIPLYVPNGTVNAYKNALYWNNLANNIFEEGTKVYTWNATFHNTKFSGSDMYVYVWDEGNNNKELLGKWPGKIMNQKGGNMWDYTLLTTDVLVSPMIIFNNGTGSQTADLVFTNGMVYENLLSINVDGINYAVTRNGDMLSSGEVRIAPTSNCNGEVVIPDFVTYNNNNYAVTNIADCAFQNNPQLTSVTIPRYIKKIGKQAFDGCTALTKVVWNAENCETYTEIEGNTLYMYPPFLDYETHTSNVKEIVFGEAVWVIPTALCANMENLTHIEYPEYLIEIGSYAFANCKSLATINIPEYVTTIGECAFAYCESVNTVTIPENVSSMGTAVFDGCKNITSVQWNAINCRINNHDANIYPVFFDSETQSCAVEQFVLGNKVEYIPRALCYSMNKVTSIDIPNTVKEIDDFAFYMSGLRSVTIPGCVTRLGTSAFWNCEGLENVTLSEGLSSIGDYAFSRCYNLSSIIIPNSVQTLGKEAFWSCSNMQSAVIGDGITQIDEYTFSRCSNLTSVTLGKNVQIIGQEVFWGCESMPSITLPASVTEIGQWCFENCLALTNVYAQPTVPPTICDYTFPSQITSQATLYVPNGCVDKYSNALYWRDFMKIENNNSGIDNTTAPKTQVCVVDGGITVTGIANHATVNIYSTNGILLHSTTVGCVASIYLPKGIYLVQTGNEIYKVAI